MPYEETGEIPRAELERFAAQIRSLPPIQLPNGYEIAYSNKSIITGHNFEGAFLILRKSKNNVGFIEFDARKTPIEIKVVQGIAGNSPQEFTASPGNRGKTFDTVLIDELIKLVTKAFNGKIPKIAFSYTCLANLLPGNPKMARRLMKKYLAKPDQNALAFMLKLSQRRKTGKPTDHKANENQLNAYARAVAACGKDNIILHFSGYGIAPIRTIHAARARRQLVLGAKRR